MCNNYDGEKLTNDIRSTARGRLNSVRIKVRQEGMEAVIYEVQNFQYSPTNKPFMVKRVRYLTKTIVLTLIYD